MLWFVAALTLAAVPDAGAELAHVDCSVGPTTTLRLGIDAPALPRHDAPDPRSELELVDAAGKRLALHSVWGRARCLAYLPTRGAHLVSLEAEVGVIVPVVSLVLVADDGRLLVTRLSKEDTQALALVVDALSARVALVGSRRHGPYRLFVLDLLVDTLRELGDAPAPPPVGQVVRGKWTWGSEDVGRVVELEPAVLHFEGHELRATYGKDSSKRRATPRKTQTWRLD